MKIALASVVAALALAAGAGSTVTVGEIALRTYPFSDPDPVPATSETRYPYFRYDGSTDVGVTQSWKTVTLENDRIRVILLPEVGGKVWAATDKVSGRDFLYCNHVMKFRDIAMRGPWASGGIEFNFGIIGHAPSSSTPVDWLARTNADGSASCFVSSEEFISRTVWQVEVRLGATADRFETHVTWFNGSGLPAPCYHWMNAAYSVRNDPEFLFPGTTAIGHQGEIVTRRWPFDDEGHRLDRFSGNAFGGPKSNHVLPGHNGFYGIWWPALGFGSYHRARSYEKYGRKIWLWALSREGGIWEDLLTDDDGQYTELQSGLCFNQPRYDNYRTPFKHATFAPGATKTLVEEWGPVRDRAALAADLAPGHEAPKPRPIDAIADFDWSSAYGHYVRGVQYLRERHDAQGAAELREAIAKDRFFAPAYGELAAYELRRGNCAETHRLARHALAIDAYDPLANYIDGFAYFLEGDTVTARDRLGLASHQPQYAAAALALIARAYLRDGRTREALAAAERALEANPLNRDALLARVIALRGTSRQRAIAERTLERLPLFHAIRYELGRVDPSVDFTRLVRNELPDETYLTLGSWYAETGYGTDARALFARAPRSIVALTRLGDYAVAKRLSVAGAFPFRRESLADLERAVAADGHWKFRYLLAVLKAYLGYDSEADALLDGLGDEPDEPVAYQYRASRRVGTRRLADLGRARSLGDSWRLARQFAQHYESEGELKEMLAETTRDVALYPKCNPLQIAHAQALLTNGQYRACLDFLKGVKLLPSEHRDSATSIWQAAQDALGEPRTWPESLGQGEPYATRVDNRSIEFKLANRTVDDVPPTVDFESDAAPWRVDDVTNCVVTVERSQVQQCFGEWTLRVTHRAIGASPSFILRPAAPIPVPDGADTIGAWVWFDHFCRGANIDPTTPILTVKALFRRADGKRCELPFTLLVWRNWHRVLRKLPKGLAAFEGFVCTGGTQTDIRDLHLDNLALFKEPRNPLTFRPRAKRNLKPLPGANPGLNTGAGTLPFPTREETSQPASGEPRSGEPLARFTGRAVTGSDISKLRVTQRRVGRTLIVDFFAPPGAVTELSAGLPAEARVTGTVDVPYLTFDEGGKRLGVDVLEGGFFRLGFFDWYRSNASTIKVRRGDNGCELSVIYRPDTAGRYNALSERLFITLSPEFAETLPTIANPPSPYRHIAGRRLWRVHASNDPVEDRRIWKLAHRHGFREVVICDHETQWRDGGESFTCRTIAAPMKGGDAMLADYSRYLREELGYVYGPYNNFTDFAPANRNWSMDRVARSPDGEFSPAWMRCYACRPAWGPEACETFAPILKRKFGFNAAYCDVHTAVSPWSRTDYDDRVPGAATFASTYYLWGETMLLQKRFWEGPVYSEGNHHMFYAGLTDGDYAQDRGYDFTERPWLVDFDLRKLHDLECAFGMGALATMFSRPKTLLEQSLYIPHAPTERDRERLVDRFIACTIAYGHTGFLVLDWWFSPYPKTFGRAYGRASEFAPERGEGTLYAMRSYYMVQQAAARYTQAKAKDILYFGADGRTRGVSAALLDGSIALSQVAVSYDDGTFVVANGSTTERLRGTVFGRALDLPPSGYAVWTEDGAIRVEHGDANRRARPFDYAETPDYLFIDGRGNMVEGAKARSAGCAVCRREGNDWEIIPIDNVPCAFRIDGERAIALDREGRRLGPAAIRREGGWLSVDPVPGAFSYRVTPPSQMSPQPVASPVSRSIVPRPVPQPPVPALRAGEKPVVIEKSAEVVADNGLLQRVETTFTFTNPNARVFEAELELPLPEGATVCGYELEVNGSMVPGVVCEKEAARTAFENEKRRSVDPGLVEHVRGNVWRTRIYPLSPNVPRKAKVAYIVARDTPSVADGTVVVERDGEDVFVGRRRAAAERGRGRAERLREATSGTLYWDASMSREGKVAADRNLLECLPETGAWDLVVFRNVIEKPVRFTSRTELLRAIDVLVYDGGTCLAAVDRLAAAASNTFIFTDERDEEAAARRTLDVTRLARSENPPAEAKPGRLLATAWAAHRIADLSGAAEANKAELLALGRRYSIASPVTSLIVLETLDQYLRHRIEPPETMSFHAEWKRRRAAEDDPIAAQKAKTEHLQLLLQLWEERVKWWNDPIPPKRTPKSGLFDGLFSRSSRVSSVEREEVADEGAPAMSAATAGARNVERRSMAQRREPGKVPAAEQPAAPSVTITIARWDPKTPYLKAIGDAPKGEAYAEYLRQRVTYGSSPAFYLDCAGWFFKANERLIAVRIISNLSEMKLEDAGLWRTMGWRLREADALDEAVETFRHVLEMRGEEPQSRRDLALVLTERGKERFSSGDRAAAARDLAEAMGLLHGVAFKPTARRSGRRGNDMQTSVIALEELNGLIAWTDAQDWAGTPKPQPPAMDAAYRRDLPLALRIMLSWDTDETDVDLHVLEPNGEEAFYRHRRTSSGGFVSEDVTTGYGPEEYLRKDAEKGVYRILANYYASHRQALTGAAVVTATVYTDWGRQNEKRRIISFRLDKPKDKHPIGEVKVE